MDAELLVYGDIGDEFMGGMSARMFQQELAALGPVANLTVKINSGGGLAFDGIAMMNALKTNPAHVTVEVMGLAASAASIVAMGGDEVVMRKGSMMMIHLPYGLVLGTAGDMRQQADILDKMTDQLIAIYKTRSRKREETLRAMLEAETWMDGDQAVAAGLADRVDSAPAEPKAKIEAGRFLNCPKELLAETAKAKLADPWRLRAARRREAVDA